VLPFPNGALLIGQLQSTHSKPGGTNCPDCDHSRPIVGQQQVFTAGTSLTRHSDTQGCFLASPEGNNHRGAVVRRCSSAAQHLLPGRPRSCGEGLAAYALALEARAGTAIGPTCASSDLSAGVCARP